MAQFDSDHFISNLTEHDYGWEGSLPDDVGLFFGQPIGIEIETRPVSEDGPPPPVSRDERMLVRKIIAELPQVLTEAKKQFIRYTAKKDPDASEQVREPHIWINRDELEEEDNPERWTFVIGREDLPDFGYHIEFDGLTCLEIWSGG